MFEANYKPAGKAGYQERFDNWKTAIGLQAVDNLTPSEHLIQLAQEHIEGRKTIDEVEKLAEGYYQDADKRKSAETIRQAEADLVSARIAKFLETKTFTLTENSLKVVHKRLFAGFDDYSPGKYRTIDIVKSEWVLDGDTVQYGHWEMLEDEIALLIRQEQSFDYSRITKEARVNHLVDFTSKLWVLHPFLEGNTRTVAILIVKYLRSLGFDIDNQPFEKDSWYFRNALVRANYRNAAIGIAAEDTHITRFFRYLLLNEKSEFKNRTVHIYWEKESSDPINDPINDPISSIAKLVLQEIVTNPHITYDELAAAVEKSRATVKRAIGELKEANLIVRVGSRKDGHWKTL